MRILSISRTLALGSLAVSLWSAAYGQSAGKPEFEVADVRVDKSDTPVSAEFSPGGQVSLRGMPMKLLTRLRLPNFHFPIRLQNGPSCRVPIRTCGQSPRAWERRPLTAREPRYAR